MKVLFDQGTPVPLRRHLSEHLVDTVFERGWSTLSNGALLAQAESEDYQVLVTTDQNMRHQQNLTEIRLAIVVLLSTAWPDVQRRIDDIRAAIDGIGPGELREIAI